MAKHLTHFKVGDKAPNFKGVNQHGDIVSSNDFKGKKIVLFFYPKDNTPGCTAEACNLRDNYAALQKAGYSVLGISADDEQKHLKFIQKFDLPFSLIADVDRKIIEDFDVWGEKKFMGKIFDGINRTTFVINEKGTFETVITEVNTKNHSEQILNEL